MTPRYLSVLLTALLSSCGGPSQGPFCQQYYGCVISNNLGHAAEAYGPLGVCWEKGKSEAEACEQECNAALDRLGDICLGLPPETDADTDADADADADTDTDTDADADTDADTDADSTPLLPTADTGTTEIVYDVSGTLTFPAAKGAVSCQVGVVNPNAVTSAPSANTATTVPLAQAVAVVGGINPTPWTFTELEERSSTGVYVVATCDADRSGTYDSADPSAVVGVGLADVLPVPSAGHTITVSP